MRRPIIILLLVAFLARTQAAMLVSEGDWKFPEGFKVSVDAKRLVLIRIRRNPWIRAFIRRPSLPETAPFPRL